MPGRRHGFTSSCILLSMSLRFRPPPLAVPPAARWMLLRAFGPAGAAFPGPVDPDGALAMARRFEVSARIVARQGRQRLAAELGAEAAAGFGRDRVAAAAVGLRLMAAARRVAVRAAELGVPVAFLKFVGLEGAGILAAGSRDACDVDALVPADRAGELWRALVAAGWRGSGLPVAELPGRCAAPAPEVQAAHVLVHGIGQHGYWPTSYSLLKMVGDLIDLEAVTSLAAITPRALGWVARDVAAAEAEAVRRLCCRLAAGEDPAAPWDGLEETLLRHILAGRLDPEYETALRLGLFRAQPSDRSRPVQLARTVLGAVFLTDAQIDALYGPPRGRLGYLGRRLARPFDLAVRLGRYGVKGWRVRS